jgi:hypothetical protein
MEGGVVSRGPPPGGTGLAQPARTRAKARKTGKREKGKRKGEEKVLHRMESAIERPV